MLLERCRPLTRDQFHQRFEIGLGSLHDNLTHVGEVMRRWADRIDGRPLRPALAGIPGRPDIQHEAKERTPDELLAMLVPEAMRPPVRRSLIGWGLALAALFALVLVWRLTPLRTLLSVDRVAALGEALRDHPSAPFAVLAAYLVGTLVFFPITLLLGATALVFPAPLAIAYCLAGGLSAASTTYWIGRLVGRFRPRWLLRPRVVRVGRQLRRRGILAVIAARMLPVGNFALINITAGAFGIPFRDYLIGNAIGMLPGVLALTVFADRIAATVRHPHAVNLIALAAVAAALAGALWWLKRRIARRR